MKGSKRQRTNSIVIEAGFEGRESEREGDAVVVR